MPSASLRKQLAACENRQSWPKCHDPVMEERLCEVLPKGDAAYGFLACTASASPYLARLFLQQDAVLADLLETCPEQSLHAILVQTERLAERSDVDETKVALRGLKVRAAMLLAIVDLAGLWSTHNVMQALSDFADKAVAAALGTALNALVGDGVPAAGRADSFGLAVFALGKLGAGELNYSSDVDLVVFYDPSILVQKMEKLSLPPRLRAAPQLASHVTRLMVDILQEQRPDGYVFRTDLRLRPDPGSSAIAVAVRAAEKYYEAYGQNWERAAFIKARMVIGDGTVATQVREILRPFIWRKYLDYATIADIHGIKRQIHASKGGHEFSFAGHDIKTGLGGIREIEFFVQTQQLILGGKNENLRVRETLSALGVLAEVGQVDSLVAAELAAAYLFLRNLEHRIQMVNDEQTHIIPKGEQEILRLARLCGYSGREELEAMLGPVLRFVHEKYAQLFHDDTASNNELLVFTGVDEDVATLETLAGMGFAHPALVVAAVRHWYSGNLRAARTARARGLLPAVVPMILQALARGGDPDAAFSAFDGFLRNLPTGVQFFSLLQKNASVLDNITRLVSLSPRHRKLLARRAYYVEAMLDLSFLHGAPGSGFDAAMLMRRVAVAPEFEASLNVLRRQVKEARFRVSCQVLLCNADCRAVGDAFAHIADGAVRAALPVARAETERSQGRLVGQGEGDAGLAVLGLGRLGSSALTAISDLDLIFVYECSAALVSDNTKSVDGVTWYTRYVRRLVTTLSAQTEEGWLYEVDMALRPSGGAGPAAVNFSAFQRYYQTDVWTWELMALTRARIVAGEGGLPGKLAQEVDNILTQPRERQKLQVDVLAMRKKLLAVKPARGRRDVKRIFGGLTDIDFICQYLCLCHGHKHGRFAPHVSDGLQALAAKGLLDLADAQKLEAAREAYEVVLQISRTALEQQTERLPKLLEAQLAIRLGLSKADEIDSFLACQQEQVREIFTRLVGAV